MPEEIPQEQLERIRPMLDRFLSAFQKLEVAIPLETDSALTYRLEPEEHR
jgi:hypothetical protein